MRTQCAFKCSVIITRWDRRLIIIQCRKSSRNENNNRHIVKYSVKNTWKSFNARALNGSLNLLPSLTYTTASKKQSTVNYNVCLVLVLHGFDVSFSFVCSGRNVRLHTRCRCNISGSNARHYIVYNVNWMRFNAALLARAAQSLFASFPFILSF